MADSLLLLLNVSIPFSLYTSFDYLGFWLYGVFAVLVMIPLYGDSISSRVAAVALGVFGVLYQAMLVALLVGVIAATDITAYFMSVALLLLVVVIAMAFHFKAAMAQVEG